IAVAVGLLFALAIVEVGLRFRAAGEHRYMASDPLLHHRLKPNLRTRVSGVEFNTNSLGLREREIMRPKPAGVFRVLMLGDSFTEGAGLPVEATVAKRVESALNGHGCRTTVEVLNAGVASYSPILEYLQLKHVVRLQREAHVLELLADSRVPPAQARGPRAAAGPRRAQLRHDRRPRRLGANRRGEARCRRPARCRSGRPAARGSAAHSARVEAGGLPLSRSDRAWDEPASGIP